MARPIWSTTAGRYSASSVAGSANELEYPSPPAWLRAGLGWAMEFSLGKQPEFNAGNMPEAIKGG